MKIKKLYGCMDMETGELQGYKKYGGELKYAYCTKSIAKQKFQHLLIKDSKYRLVELRGIPLLEDR